MLPKFSQVGDSPGCSTNGSMNTVVSKYSSNGALAFGQVGVAHHDGPPALAAAGDVQAMDFENVYVTPNCTPREKRRLAWI